MCAKWFDQLFLKKKEKRKTNMYKSYKNECKDIAP